MKHEKEASPVPVIGIGASAGGLEAISEMLASVPADSGMAFVVVQHLDPTHESLLAELLSRQTSLPVKQVEGGERIDGNHVYIIPPGHGLSIKNNCLILNDFAQPRGLRRPIDEFFISLATDQEGEAACVILSGTGADGATGLRAIKEHGGLAIAQEPETARYDGMPVSAIGTGLVDFVCAPNEIVERLRAFFERKHYNMDSEEAAEIVAEHVDDMCNTVREVIGHDFSGYKKSTLIRRIERRMQVLGIDRPTTYLDRIRGDSDECEALFRDLLINVTRFFRDSEMFEDLDRLVIRPLVDKTPANREIRVWIPGCSSGEEAYSIAILFAHALTSRMPRPLVQIFATDIDESMLAIAREGRYPQAALGDIPEHLREHFTIGREGIFQISPKVRDLIRFSNHSLVKDPPFSKVDLISCRNLLIYMGDELQKKVFPIFHYALNPGGHLFLGPSESIGRHEDMFAVSKQKSRLFQRKDGRPVYPIELPASIGPGKRTKREKAAPYPNRLSWEESLSVRHIVDRYAPATMVVDTDGSIVKSNGRLAKYFEYPDAGTNASFAVSLARPGLREVLPRLIRQAVEERKLIIARDVIINAEFGSQKADIVADPLPDETILLIFRDNAPFEPGDGGEILELAASDGEMQLLQDELRLTRHRLRGTVEELETANEELKSSNEEMMSMNEELQSTNEELTTVNDELKTKVDELTVANSDIRNFFESTALAVIVLDSDMRIRSFTDATTTIFPLKTSDRGRALSDVASKLDDDPYLRDAYAVMQGAEIKSKTVTSHVGTREWALNVLPYHLPDGTTDGALIIFNEITEAQQIQRDLAGERERLELAVRVASIGVWEYQPGTGVTILDRTNLALFGVSEDASEDIEALMAVIDNDDRPAVEESLRRAVAGESDFQGAFRVNRPDGTVRHLRGLGRLMEGAEPRKLIGVTFDVTPETLLAEQREFLLSEMNHRVKNLFAIVASFVSGAARTATTPQELAIDIRARIEALGRSHALTQVHTEVRSVNLSALVSASLAPYKAEGNILITGPEVEIDVEQVTPLALIFHELATNSAKYGALVDQTGTIDVSWALRSDGTLEMVWSETTTKTGQPETSRKPGFGSRLIKYSALQIKASFTEEKSDGAWEARLAFPVNRA